MSNYSETTQDSFGDGSHVPPEELPDGDLESDTTTLTVMKNIFLACDKSNSNSAQVSDLINVIIPHLQESSSQLKMLKIALDPKDTDPCINSETFFKIMKKWKESVQADGDDSTVRELQDAGNESKHSTLLSKSSGLFKGCLESDSLSFNLSSSSICSPTRNNGIDVSLLQERINELEHRNRILTTDLEHSRAQLTTSEEQNEALQGDVQKLSRRLLSVQQTNSQLEKDQQNTEELKEILSTTQKQLGKVEKDFMSSEKQVHKLKQQIHNLQVEHRKFQDKTDQFVKRDAESKQLIQKLQAELQIKELQYSSLEDDCTQANIRLNEQKQLVLHYQNVNKSLKEDKIKMEKHYCEAMKTRMSSSHIKFSRTSSDSSVSSKSGTFTNPTNLIPEKESQQKPTISVSVTTHPFYKEPQYNKRLTTLFRNKGFIYNSPRTLHMVENLVSPPLHNSATILSSACRKSVDSNSPQFICAAHEMSPYIASTPEKSKTLSDITPPSIIKRLPHLLPTKRPLSSKKDRQLFRQYRFVGSSSEDEETDSKTEQQLDINLNDISQESKESLCLGCDAQKERKSSLLTMYVVEHSCGRIRSTCDSSSSPTSLRNIADSSYEGDPLLWKSSQQVSPRESLQSEIAQAKLVDKEKAELRNMVEQLQAENNRLQNCAGRVKTYSPEKHDRYYESEGKALKNKIQELENDNYQKYLKIVDFLEEIEKLKKELKRISGKDIDEIKKLQQNISELHQEKKSILHDLQQQKLEKQNSDSIITNVQSIKDSCDNLQTVLQHSKQNSEELYNELEKISADKLVLRVNVDKLKKSIFEVNEKNKTIYTQLQNLSDEYFKFKLKNSENSGLRRPQDYVTPTLIKQEPLEPLPAQNEDRLEIACKENEKTLHLLQEETETLKIVITEHESTILLLKKNITENKTEIVLLKQNIAQQTEKLEEQKFENKRLVENNKALTQNINATIKTLDIAQKENKYLSVRISNLEVENKSILADCKYIKDSNNKLTAEKETLGKQCEQLRNDYENMKELKQNNTVIQSLTYGRMQTTIEKLKAKLFEAEEELKNEKEKITNVVFENAKLKVDIDQNKKTYIQENKTSEKENCRLQKELIKNKKSLFGYVADVNQQLHEKRMQLYCSTLTAVHNWRTTFKNEPDNKAVLEIFDKVEPPSPQQTIDTLLEEEIYKFKHQIEVTSLILDTLGKWKIPHLPMASTTDEPQSTPVSTHTPQKSVTGTIQNTKTVAQSLTPYHSNSPTKNTNLQSRDSRQSRDSSPNKLKNYDGVDNTRTCGIETDLVCYNSEGEDDLLEDNMLSEDEEVELGLGSIENTPSLSSSTLESLGLLCDGDSPSWSKKEIEEKFYILVTCFMIDVATIKERSKKQQTLQSKIENKFTMELEKVITILKNIRQLKRDHQIKGLVTTCLGHIKKLTRMFSLTSVLAVQSGALQHEQHSLKIINVMINHAANLAQVLQNVFPRFSNPREKKSSEVSHSTTIKVSSIFGPPVMLNEVEEIGNMEVEEITNMNQHLSSSGSSEDERKMDDDSSTVPDLTQNKLLFYALLCLVLLFFAIVFVSGISISRNNSSECHGLWSEILTPFLKRIDPNVPFPT